MTKRYPDPSPPQGQLNLGPYKLVPQWVGDAIRDILKRTDCGIPYRFSQDQYRCNVCNRIWDIDDAPPNCVNDQQT